MARDRSLFSNYFLCVSVLGMALIGITLGLMGLALISIASGLAVVANDAEAGLSQPEKTYLNIRMESLREIRQALAKPLPLPEPLARITAGVARTSGTSSKFVNAQLSRHRSPSSRHELNVEARNVLEKIEPAGPDAQLNAYAVIDRHFVH
jgi:hypothetical protein